MKFFKYSHIRLLIKILPCMIFTFLFFCGNALAADAHCQLNGLTSAGESAFNYFVGGAFSNIIQGSAGLAWTLFKGLACVEIAWFAVQNLWKKQSFEDLFADLAFKIVGVMAVGALIVGLANAGGNAISETVTEFGKAGFTIGTGAGGPGAIMTAVQPSGNAGNLISTIIQTGICDANSVFMAPFQAISTIFTKASSGGVLGALDIAKATMVTIAFMPFIVLYLVLWIVIVCIFCYLAGEVFVALFEAFLLLAAGFFLLGLMGSSWTRSYGEKWIGYFISVCLRVFTIELVAGFGTGLIHNIISTTITNIQNETNSATVDSILSIGITMLQYAAEITVTIILIAMLAKKLPALASQLGGSGGALGMGDAVSAVEKAAALGATAAAVVATGGAGAVAGMKQGALQAGKIGAGLPGGGGDGGSMTKGEGDKASINNAPPVEATSDNTPPAPANSVPQTQSVGSQSVGTQTELPMEGVSQNTPPATSENEEQSESSVVQAAGTVSSVASESGTAGVKKAPSKTGSFAKKAGRAALDAALLVSPIGPLVLMNKMADRMNAAKGIDSKNMVGQLLAASKARKEGSTVPLQAQTRDNGSEIPIGSQGDGSEVPETETGSASTGVQATPRGTSGNVTPLPPVMQGVGNRAQQAWSVVKAGMAGAVEGAKIGHKGAQQLIGSVRASGTPGSAPPARSGPVSGGVSSVPDSNPRLAQEQAQQSEASQISRPLETAGTPITANPGAAPVAQSPQVATPHQGQQSPPQAPTPAPVQPAPGNASEELRGIVGRLQNDVSVIKSAPTPPVPPPSPPTK